MFLERYPDVLLIEISSFITPSDRLNLLQVNKTIYTRIARAVRQINLDNSVDQFFESQSFREKICQLINNPHEQLSLFCRYYETDDLDHVNTPLISCHKLNGMIKHFFTLFQSRRKNTLLRVRGRNIRDIKH